MKQIKWLWRRDGKRCKCGAERPGDALTCGFCAEFIAGLELEWRQQQWSTPRQAARLYVRDAPKGDLELVVSFDGEHEFVLIKSA